MRKKFEINRTKIKDGCQSGRKAVTHNCKNDLPLGSNRYCLDKNYAGVLIIWDRMFGTFEWERDDEKVVYGLVDQPQFFNPLRHQVNTNYILTFIQFRVDCNRIFLFYLDVLLWKGCRKGTIYDFMD